MIVIISALFLAVWLGYTIAVEKDLIKPLKFKSNRLKEWLILPFLLMILLSLGVVFGAFQSLTSDAVGTSDVDFRRGRLVATGERMPPARYVQTKWFGFVEEINRPAMRVPESEEGNADEAEWKYLDSKGKWHYVPRWITSPEDFSDDRDGYTDNRGFHE